MNDDLDLIRNALDWFRDGQDITSDDLCGALHAGQVPKSQWGPLMGRACHEGWITRVGSRQSRRRSRKGAWISLYRVNNPVAWRQAA